MDDLLDEIADEVEIDSHAPNPVEDIESRLAHLRYGEGERISKRFMKCYLCVCESKSYKLWLVSAFTILNALFVFMMNMNDKSQWVNIRLVLECVFFPVTHPAFWFSSVCSFSLTQTFISLLHSKEQIRRMLKVKVVMELQMFYRLALQSTVHPCHVWKSFIFFLKKGFFVQFVTINNMQS